VKPLLIGIAGGSGSGKSTVARNVASALGAASVAFIDMDAYYHSAAHLSMDARRKINFDHPNAIDWDLLLAQLSALAARKAIDKPEYDFATHTRSEKTTHVAGADVVVVDGILVLTDPRVRDLFDVKVFVDTDADIRFIRRMQRDLAERGRPVDEIVAQYLNTVQPMHLEFVEPSKRYADVIVPRGGDNAVAIEMIAAKIRQRVRA
jgi:uridine kinase